MTGRGTELLVTQLMGGFRRLKYNASCDLRHRSGELEIKFSELHQGGRCNFSNIVGLVKDRKKWDLLVLVGRRARRIAAQTSMDSELFFICLTWDEVIELLGGDEDAAQQVLERFPLFM